MPKQFPIVFVRQEDYQLSQDETMGTKSKFWFEHPNLGRCLYKHIRPNTGEDWAEKAMQRGLDGFHHRATASRSSRTNM